MSHDARYISPLHRAPAPSPLDSTRPAVFHRARVIEIKRLGPSATHASALSNERTQQHASVDPAWCRPSPAARVDAGTASMRFSPFHARDYMHSSPNPCDVPPPPPPHSQSQRTVNIAQGSYMDYEASGLESRPSNFSQPHPSSRSPSHRGQQPNEYDSRTPPSAAFRAAHGFQHGVAAEAIPHQSAPPPCPPREQDLCHSTRLLPTRVRPPQAFQFELEEEFLLPSTSQLDIPGRFPSSSPDTSRLSQSSVDTEMDGLQEDAPDLRPKPGSYRDLQPHDLGMIYSNPGHDPATASHPDGVQHHSDHPAAPFLYEIRSPRKRDHAGSNKPFATSMRAAYGARNPAQEAGFFPLLRRLGADERYATSFRTQHSDHTFKRAVADDGSGEEEAAISDVRN